MWRKQGCGEVLRDDGVARALFSGPCYAKDSSAAEIVVIITTLDMCLDMRWIGKGSLIIETGEDLVINLLMHNRLRPWALQTSFSEIETRMAWVGKVCFSKAKKSGNEMAFALGIEGIKRSKMFKAWW